MGQLAGRPVKPRRVSVPLLHPARWPGPVQRLMLTGGVVGSFLGLVLGLMSVNRPLLNGLLFYLLGFLFGVLARAAAGLLLVAARAGARARSHR